MPVAIACPKCQTRYQLPDSARGKQVKCKKCGATFRTKPSSQQRPGAQPGQPQPGNPQTAVRAGAPNPTANELARYGIDGPLQRPADIFGGAASSSVSPLGNYVDDPGFADIDMVEQEVAVENVDSGMASIIDNPYMSGKSGAGRKSGRVAKRAERDVSGYGPARIGMWIIFIAGAAIFGLTAVTTLIQIIHGIVPDIVESAAQSFSPSVLGIVVGAALVVWGISVLSVFVGMILCIFSPNSNERFNAGMSVGSIVAVFAFGVMAMLTGAAAMFSDGGIASAAAAGLFLLISVVGIWAGLIGCTLFFIRYYKFIGKNLRSKALVKLADTAILIWVASIVVGIFTGIAIGVIGGMQTSGRGPSNTFMIAQTISGIINAVLSLGMLGAMLMMVRKAIELTKPKGA